MFDLATWEEHNVEFNYKQMVVRARCILSNIYHITLLHYILMLTESNVKWK